MRYNIYHKDAKVVEASKLRGINFAFFALQ
jgi:hypothetical protein